MKAGISPMCKHACCMIHIMRVLIISDSHGKTENIEYLKGKVGKIDLVLHCGDGISDIDYIGDIFKCKAFFK